MSTQLQIPCLGRPFALGMLYNCRSERLIPGITLWDTKKLKSFSQIKKQPSTSFEIIAEDTISKKSDSLGIDANLKLCLMCGLVKVKGAAKFLKDEKSSQKQSRVTLQYRSTTHFEQLTMDQIGDIQFPQVLADQDATHVVTGITYGADAFFVFDRAVSENEKQTDVHGKMQVAVASVPVISSSISGSAGIDYKDTEKSETDKFQCKFHGDMLLNSNPSTFEEAIKLYSELPKMLNGEVGSVPKLVYLSPLSKLNGVKSQKIVRSISFDLISQVEEIMEQFHSTEMCINDLLKHDVCSKFVDIYSQLSKAETLLTRFKVKFVKDLSGILPKIRSTGAKEKELAKLISSVNASPFSFNETDKYLKGKDREIKQLGQYLKNVQKEACIQLDFPDTSCDLSTLAIDDEFEFVACFAFNVTSESSSYLQNLECYLQTGQTKSNAGSDEWINKPSVTKELRAKSKKFLDFVKENSSEKNTAFVVTGSNQDTDESGPTIILYCSGAPIPFDPPGVPGNPVVTPKTKTSIAISWTPPKSGTIASYTVLYRLTSETKFKTKDTTTTNYTLGNLKPGSAYEIQVHAISESGYPTKSEIILVKTESDNRLADGILKFSIPIDPQAKPVVYKLPMTLVAASRKDGLYRYEVEIPKCAAMPSSLCRRSLRTNPKRRAVSANPVKKCTVKPEKVLMVVGATGAGKSTLINGMANFVFGVTWEDVFRFKVITDEGSGSQAHSQTRNITAYSFRNTTLPFDLTIIDTPGFGDTDGITRDRLITKQIKKFFSRGNDCSVDQLHGIGFVTQASLPRLTPTQKYIFDSILSIFGKDIGSNIFLMVTFADGGKPTVLEGVEAADIKYQESFKFNNSALFASGSASDDQSFDSMFWKMGYASFENFFNHFTRAEARSLALTREVLKEREQLETLIPGLQDQVRIGMLQMNTIQEEEKIVKQFKAELNANEKFTYEITVTKFRKNQLAPGTHTTTCSTCNFTCHKNCAYSDDASKARCCAMINGKCGVCPRKCDWNMHSNVPYVFEYYQATETHTSDELKAKYDTALSGKESTEAMLKKNEEDLINMQVEVYILIEQIQASIKHLEEIALKPNPLTDLQYLDLLIESEKQEVKPGWEQRVKQYTEFRKDAELYQKVATSGVDSVDLIRGDQKPQRKKQVQKYLRVRKQAKEKNIPTQSWWSRAKGFVKEKLGY